MNNINFFGFARPIWTKNFETEMNITLGLYKKVYFSGETAVLKIATSGFYKVFLNGIFFTFGPARCAHNYFRVDELNLPLKSGENHIAIEVVNYYVNNFYQLRQPGFITAELILNNSIYAATGDLKSDFELYRLTERIRHIQRYSFQRTFAECYSLNEDYNNWKIGGECENAVPGEKIICPKCNLLPRGIPENHFPDISPDKFLGNGAVMLGIKPLKYWDDRSLTEANLPENKYLKGFPENELEVHLSDELLEMPTVSLKNKTGMYCGKTQLSEKEFEVLSFPCEKTGFICADIKADFDSELYFIFDEILTDKGDVNPLRLLCCNAVKLFLKKGNYSFMSAEPYGLKYMKLLCTKGKLTVNSLHIKEVFCPVPVTLSFQSSDTALNKIIDAAKESFIQNSFDLFTDCPTRERAGWLCDSFFIGRAEMLFTGKNIIERNFLENFLLIDKIEGLPDAMFPMCYPSEFKTSGEYIPNWAMWLVLELNEYKKRTGDFEFIKKFENKITSLLHFFKSYENSDGLLEKLPSWVFVEWSKANDFVQDINFPSNMLYAMMLDCSAELLNRNELHLKAETLRELIRSRSFDGKFFRDNEIYKNGIAEKTGNRTETCQYYAFFTGVATPELYPELWNTLVNSFGPNRINGEKYPDVYPSNAFIGYLLRLEILCQNGNYTQALSEIKDYYLYMADKTGTLWEMKDTSCSCNHGFTSYIANLIIKAEKSSAAAD